jgi:hypothetical protein
VQPLADHGCAGFRPWLLIFMPFSITQRHAFASRLFSAERFLNSSPHDEWRRRVHSVVFAESVEPHAQNLVTLVFTVADCSLASDQPASKNPQRSNTRSSLLELLCTGSPIGKIR